MNNKKVKALRKQIKEAGAKSTAYFHKVTKQLFTDPMGNHFPYTTEQVRLVPHSVKRLMKEAKKGTDGWGVDKLNKEGFVPKT